MPSAGGLTSLVGAIARAVRPETTDETTHVGVVCVHGIGFQHPGQTLLEWTGPIATALVGWRSRLAAEDLLPPDRDWPRDLVETSDVDLTGERPSYVTFRIPGLADIEGAATQRWTFTEAYWAAKLEPPSLRMLIDWTGREGIVGRVVQGVLGRNAPGFLRRPVEVAGVLWLGVFVSALTSLVLLAYTILRSILAIIPIQAARDLVTYGQGERFLVGWWGDARSLVRDPVQSATVRLSLDAAITDLRERHACTKIVVIAHSGGTIVSYMTLSDPALPASADTLITHGQAIELGRRLESLEDPGDASASQQQLQPSVTRIRRVADRDDLRVGRWRDFHGTHDPAPIAEPSDLMLPTRRDGDETIEVTNLRSIRGDHGAYWSNDESFVLPVMTEIERAGSGGSPSRFTRGGPIEPDDAGVARRENRVAMRSLWGRLALVGPLAAILFAAGVAGGSIEAATVLDTPGRMLAENYERLPLHEVGTAVHEWVAGTAATAAHAATEPALPPGWQDAAIATTRATFFLLFTIAALWACIPVGGWSRLPRGAVVADILTSAVVPLAALAAVFGLGPVQGISFAPEFWIVAGATVVVLLVSAVVYWLYINGQLLWVPGTALSAAVICLILAATAAAVIAFIVQPETRRWVVDTIVAVIAVRLVVSLGMWRWDAWDAAERQWFRGPRDAATSRFAVYGIASLLGLLVVAIVALLGGLVAPLAGAGVPLVEHLPSATLVGGGALVLYLVVRDVSIAESVRG